MSNTLNFTVRDYRQPPVTRAQVDGARGVLTAYRVLAFLTGVLLPTGCILLIVKGLSSAELEPATGYVWIAHGWCFFVYVIVTAVLGFKLRWPLPRYVLIGLAGTIPTMSFVAEHFVTKAIRESTQPVPAVRD